METEWKESKNRKAGQCSKIQTEFIKVNLYARLEFNLCIPWIQFCSWASFSVLGQIADISLDQRSSQLITSFIVWRLVRLSVCSSGWCSSGCSSDWQLGFFFISYANFIFYFRQAPLKLIAHFSEEGAWLMRSSRPTRRVQINNNIKQHRNLCKKENNINDFVDDFARSNRA